VLTLDNKLAFKFDKKTVKLSELVMPDYNAKVSIHDDPETYEDLYNSLEKLGYIDTITVNVKDDKNIIVGGNQRYTVMCDMAGEQKVPLNEVDVDVLVVQFDEPLEMVANLALNRIHTDWVQKKIQEDMAQIREFDESLVALTGFTEDETNMMRADMQIEETVPAEEKPKEFKFTMKLPAEYEAYYEFYLQSSGEEALKKEIMRILMGASIKVVDDGKKRK
jgi:ParB-like chromosome segregation protein Spo0J